MKKLLFVLALFSSPVVAEPVMPGPDATYEERLEYVRALNAETARKHKETLARIEQIHREAKVKMGLPADYETYGSGRGCRYSCVTTVITNGKVYRFQVSRR